MLDAETSPVHRHPDFRVYKAPERTPDKVGPSVFLAGSIDMGQAADWQAAVQNAVCDLPIQLYNPRRDKWDPTWEQDISNPPFREQVEWELDHLDKADIIIFYFDPKGQSPITLLELGHYAEQKPIFVCCPKGFWRRGNVQVFCSRHDIPVIDILGDLILGVRECLVHSLILGAAHDRQGFGRKQTS